MIIRWTSSGTVATRLIDRDDRRPDGDVRHEVAVHDVDVNQVGAAALHGGDRLAERGEVGREDRRRDAARSSADLERDRLARADLKAGLRTLAEHDAGGDAGIGIRSDDGDAEAARRGGSRRHGRR